MRKLAFPKQNLLSSLQKPYAKPNITSSLKTIRQTIRQQNGPLKDNRAKSFVPSFLYKEMGHLYEARFSR